MAIELEPNKPTAVTLPNACWVFLTNVLRQMPYGNMVDAGMQDLLLAINKQVVDANPVPEVGAGEEAPVATE